MNPRGNGIRHWRAGPLGSRGTLSPARLQRCVEAYLCQQGLEGLVQEYGFDRSGKRSRPIDSGTLWYE